MNLEIEKKFIEKFIQKDYQKRILFELTKKRNKALSRFSHNAYDILKKDLTISLIKDENSILSFIPYKKISNKECYLISRFFDGITMKFDAALKISFEDLCSSIIVLNDFAIIKEETIKGQPNIFLIESK